MCLIIFSISIPASILFCHSRLSLSLSLSMPLSSLVIHVSLFLYLYPCLYSLLSFTSLSFSISIRASILSCHSRLSLSLSLSMPLSSRYSSLILFNHFVYLSVIHISLFPFLSPFSFLLKNLHRFVNCGRTRLPFALSHSLA